jgi:S-adenosylmethionine hydrolase
MHIVTLTTDFGTADYYAAQFKGDILRHKTDVHIIDLSHDIPIRNIVSGAYALKHSFLHFPAGSVHIIRVDEQGIDFEAIIVAYSDKHFFLGPDNGILSLVFYREPEWIFALDVDKLGVKRTNEAYAAITKMILENGELEFFLKEKSDIRVKQGLQITKLDKQVRGTVVIVDRFGNLITNIHIRDVMSYLEKYEHVVVQYRGKSRIVGISEKYSDVDQGDSLARFNDEGYLEIALNGGNAASLLGIKFGDFVNMIFE